MKHLPHPTQLPGARLLHGTLALLVAGGCAGPARPSRERLASDAFELRADGRTSRAELDLSTRPDFGRDLAMRILAADGRIEASWEFRLAPDWTLLESRNLLGELGRPPRAFEGVLATALCLVRAVDVLPSEKQEIELLDPATGASRRWTVERLADRDGRMVHRASADGEPALLLETDHRGWPLRIERAGDLCVRAQAR